MYESHLFKSSVVQFLTWYQEHRRIIVASNLCQISGIKEDFLRGDAIVDALTEQLFGVGSVQEPNTANQTYIPTPFRRPPIPLSGSQRHEVPMMPLMTAFKNKPLLQSVRDSHLPSKDYSKKKV